MLKKITLHTKKALKDASPSYKTRNEKKPEEIPIIEPTIKVLQKKKNLLNLHEKILLKKWLKILL